MTKAAFDKIMAGVQDIINVAEGRADPGTLRISVPKTLSVEEGLHADGDTKVSALQLNRRVHWRLAR